MKDRKGTSGTTVLIFGSSGHGRSVAEAAAHAGAFEIAGFIDVKGSGQSGGRKVLGTVRDLPQVIREARVEAGVIAIGDNVIRGQVADEIRQVCPSFRFVPVIHPRAIVARNAEIGEGAVVLAGGIVGACARIGSHAIVNTGASIDHDCSMGEFSSLAPGVAVGGACKIGEYAAVGIGAVVSHGLSIGAHSVIGAGATVLKDIEPFKVAYGVPARVIRERSKGERYL